MKRPLFLPSRLFIFSPILVLCFLCSAKAETPFLGTQETLKRLLQKVESESVFTDREWLLLGHYKKFDKPSADYLSQVDGETFFLSPEGKSSPKAELLATLKAFFDPVSWHIEEKLHPQCRFPARRRWLVEELDIQPTQLKLLPCQHQTDWKNKLNAESISIIFAASYMNNPASMFGHTFLKFHNRDQDSRSDLLNYGLNFAATTGSDGGAAFMIKGLLGGYKGEFSLMPYYLKLLDYSNVEGRDIWEYKLALTATEVDRLVDHLLELEQTYFDYYFFSENCSYQLLGLIEWARPSLQLQDYFFYEVIPADTITLLAQQENLIAEIKYRPALQKNLEGRLKLLNNEEKNITKNFFEHQNVEVLLSSIKSRQSLSQAHILDAALAFGAIQEFKDHIRWKKPLFQLQSARAQLGITAERLTFNSHQGPPHEAHPPARFGLGPGYQRSHHGFLNLDFRFAYHELTDSDVGLLSGAQIQFLAFQARWNNETERLGFTRARLFDLISLSPWGIYQKPFSWKAALGYENTFSEDMAHLAGGIGASFDLIGQKKLLLGFFADAEIDYQKEFHDSHFLGAGASGILRWQVSPQFRVLLQANTLWDTYNTEWQTQTQANTSFNWNTHNQLNLRFKSKNRHQQSDNEIMLVWERFILL